jgi:hypothetical protein
LASLGARTQWGCNLYSSWATQTTTEINKGNEHETDH